MINLRQLDDNEQQDLEFDFFVAPDLLITLADSCISVLVTINYPNMRKVSTQSKL